MNTPYRPGEQPLDAELRRLPHAIEPGRDLWPGVAARLEPVTASRRPVPRWLTQAAAALLLVAGSSLLTAKLLDTPRDAGKMARVPAARTAAAAIAARPVAFGVGGTFDPAYARARRQLDELLKTRLAEMPASTRFKLETNLSEMRRAADEINEALADQPGDPLLEELLLETYQDELAVLANVNQLTAALDSAPAAPAAEAKRIPL